MKFSILMASYNAAKFIGMAIRSVLNQTYYNWELIIVDDVSVDNSIKVIEKFIDKRVRLIKRTKNGGYGNTLRTAIEHSTGEICGILDSDDTLHEEALQIMIRAYMENPEYGFIYSQYMKCNAKLNPVSKGDCAILPEGVTWLDILMKKYQKKPKPRVSHFKTFKRNDYDKTDGFHELRRTVDKDIVLKLEEVTKLLFIDKILYNYRSHPKGISRDLKTKPFGQIIKERALERRK